MADKQLFDQPPLGEHATKYLDDRAAESFKRQVDLEESIWRSLPLFSAALVAAGAIVSKASDALPPFAWRPFPTLTYALLLLAVLSFLLTTRWLWVIVKPRNYEYPADDAAVAGYAAEMQTYHATQGLADEALDKEVVRELRTFMGTTFAEAAHSTFTNNRLRLHARGKVLVYLVAGFLLAFACDALISIHGLVDRVEPSGASNARAATHATAQRSAQPAAFCETGSAADARCSGRSIAVHVRP